jgi:CubicO group peptidase (beta-lactamase class C family)
MILDIKQLILDSIDKGAFPGAVACIYSEGQPLFLEAYGNRMIVPERLPMRKDTLFDLASLTKPVATATAIMILKEKGLVDLEREVSAYLPEFSRPGITVFHLLTHTSGLPAWVALYLKLKDRAEVVKYLAEMPLEYETGSRVVYSCLSYIVLEEMLRKVTGIGLDVFTQDHIFKPLGMKDTFYNPPADHRDECAATEDSSSSEKRMTNYSRYNWREGVVVGEVHDENAHFLGGVTGNAGLFSTASDLARFCKMLIKGGENILSSESVKMMAKLHTSGLDGSRGIGWIILPDDVLYHTGFTGTAIWIDRKNRSAAILLTNRVHPDATKEGIMEVRQKFYQIFREHING